MKVSSLALLPLVAQAFVVPHAPAPPKSSSSSSLTTALNQQQSQDAAAAAEAMAAVEGGGGGVGMSARTARIMGPLGAAFMAAAALPNAAQADSIEGVSSRGSFEGSVGAYFPGAIPNSMLSGRLTKVLQARGFTADNTLLGSSLCSDEINDVGTSLFAQLQRGLTKGNSGGVFNLGGLGGVPFVGPSGFGAFFSHCPKSGKVVIVYGPHVGIGNDGFIGKVDRVGMDKSSGACGAALGAYKAIKGERAKQEKVTPTPNSLFPYSDVAAGDVQEDYIIRELRRKMENDSLDNADSNALIALVTNRMYEMVTELLEREVEASTNKPGFWDKVTDVTLIGGIVINKGNPTGLSNVEDYFKPINFVSWKAGGVRENLYESLYSDEGKPGNFELAVKTYFPGAIPNSMLSGNVVDTLKTKGYNADNTLLGSSLCSDEVNDVGTSLFAQLQNGLTKGNSGGVFNLGGLGGVPFVGPSGFGAFFSHCPKSGKIVIVYGPHVGVSQEGRVGKIERVGVDEMSGACGAALGAYRAIKAEKEKNEKVVPTASAAFPYSDAGAGDVQEDYIIRELRNRLEQDDLGGPNTDALIALVTNRMYDMVSDLLEKEIANASGKQGFWDKISEVTLLGGIVINQGNKAGEAAVEDWFAPVTFETLKPGGVRENLFNSLYMERPVLAKAVTAAVAPPAPLPKPVPTPVSVFPAPPAPVPVPAYSPALGPSVGSAIGSTFLTSAVTAAAVVAGTNYINEQNNAGLTPAFAAAGGGSAILDPPVTKPPPPKSPPPAQPKASKPPAPAPKPAAPAPAPAKKAATPETPFYAATDEVVAAPAPKAAAAAPAPKPAPPAPKAPAPKPAAPVPSTTSVMASDQDDSIRMSLNNALFLTALRSDRGQDASDSLIRKADSIVNRLESMSPEANPTTSADIEGTWELIYANTQLFRASPFFMAKRAACNGDSEIQSFEKFCKAQQVAISLANIGKIRQVITGTNIVSEFEVKTGTIEQAFISVGETTPTYDGQAWSITLDETYIDGLNVPLLRQLLDQKLGSRNIPQLLGATGDATMRTTYLDDTIRISRDQDDNIFVYEKVSDNTQSTDYSGVPTDFGISKVVDGLL
jgi:hypothetical protein